MRRRLVSYFDRRNRLSADELADETLNRIARTLEQSGIIRVTPPPRYCYIVARFILLEDIRRERVCVRVDDARHLDAPPGLGKRLTESAQDHALHEERLECLDGCLQRLPVEQRELVAEYYRDSQRQKIERRRDLAKKLGITMNALAIRAWRIRAALETCVEACRKARGQISRRSALSEGALSTRTCERCHSCLNRHTTTIGSWATCWACFPTRKPTASTRRVSPTMRSPGGSASSKTT
jgi:DNA-directed RNA polymerase specialized sigma24 family protein